MEKKKVNNATKSKNSKNKEAAPAAENKKAQKGNKIMEKKKVNNVTKPKNSKNKEDAPAAENKKVAVLEEEYYQAKELGGAKSPSLLQECEFGPLLKRNMIERCAGDEDIPVDELAVKEDFLPEHMELIGQARAVGAFNRGKGTVEVPETNGVVFAGIWETSEHSRVIRVLFRRGNGEFTVPIEFDNAVFTIAAQHEFMIHDKSNPFYKDVVNLHKKAVREIIDRLPLGAGIKYEKILHLLWKYHDKLPLYELIQEEASVETIYSEILQYIAAHGTERHNANAYFRLNKEEMEQIGDKLEMTVKQMCSVLKENGLLYLTKSSVAYQVKVKFKGELGNYYCVKKNFGQQSISRYEPTVLEDGTEVMHDGTVNMPVDLYQQLFGGNHPSVLDAAGSKGSKKSSGVVMWENDL